MTAQRVLRGNPADVSITLADQNGEPRPAEGPVTATVRDAFGDVLQEDVVADDGVDTGVMQIRLSATDTAELNWLRITWTEDLGGVYDTFVEVVGGYYFSITEARGSSALLRDEDKFSEQDLLNARLGVEDEFERKTGRAFVPRFRQTYQQAVAGYQPYLQLPPDARRLRGLSVDGARVATANLTITADNRIGYLTGSINFDYGLGRRASSLVSYEYGMDSPPQRVKDAALLRMQTMALITKQQVTARAEYQIVDGQQVEAPTGVRSPLVGIPEVDIVLEDWALTPTLTSIPFASA
jgi:hypothetical protein